MNRSLFGSEIWPVAEAVCGRLTGEVGLDVETFGAALHDPATERLMHDASAGAHRRGAFGVPTFLLRDELFWGNDRIVLLRHALTKDRRPD